MAERQFGPYRLVRQIAVGGMAEIHLAKTKGIAGFEKYCALKMIHPNFAEDEQFIQMLVDEAKIAVQLTHGNIAQTFDLGRVGETYYITMEYVDGADLYKILRRASEQDLEMPLDVCAFIGKEIASALDHAHRKRDHTGKPLGIVHRDVSPQNVLISYAGEVKLVDFGIAKATMKARQTAVGVIKGKYYYMSPEQAWGDPIDYRSDIFSAGIVLYEMITGQMLYLEEDLHKLLDMARKAEIEPPSRIRKGVPPQLERIVMHALSKQAGERYQSAGDFASDLERFLHTYAPVFTASKVAGLIRQVIGDPMQIPLGMTDNQGFPSVEVRDGVNSTHQLEVADLVHERDEIRDENSVIFRVSDLQPPSSTNPGVGKPRPAGGSPAAGGRAKTPAPVPAHPNPNAAPRTTRAADAVPSPRAPTPLPAIAPPRASAPTSNAKPLSRSTPSRPRQLHEETRPVMEPAPADPANTDDSGLLTADGRKVSPAVWDQTSTHPGLDGDGDLENIGERTMITGPGRAGGGFMMDFGGEDGIEATLVTSGPPAAPDPGGMSDEGTHDEEVTDGAAGRAAGKAAAAASGARGPSGPSDDDDDDDDDGPTLSQRAVPRGIAGKAPPPPALAAKIHAPAVSELRKPRPSRRTPPGGMSTVAPSNVLQQIVAARASEPMPVPRSEPPRVAQPTPPAPMPVPIPMPGPGGPVGMLPPPNQFPSATPGGQAQYVHDASGLPMGIPTPPSGLPAVQTPPGMAAYGQDPMMPGMPGQGQGQMMPGQHPMMPPGQSGQMPMMPMMPPGQSGQLPAQGYPPHPQAYGNLGTGPNPQYPVSPQGLYPFSPYGSPQPQPMSLTGQLRLSEIDEIPAQYKIGGARRRWFAYIIASVLAVSIAAIATFFVIRSTRDVAPVTGKLTIHSAPSDASVTLDGKLLDNKTPLSVEHLPVGSHVVSIELARHKTYTETVEIPPSGGEKMVNALLAPLTGKIFVNSVPGAAEIWINGQLRGRTPTTLNDIDIETAKTLEVRLKDHQPFVTTLTWPASGQIAIDAKLVR